MKVQPALQRVVEHISFLPDNRTSEDDLSVVLIQQDDRIGTQSKFRNVYSEFDKPKGSGSHEAGGNWNFIQPR